MFAEINDSKAGYFKQLIKNLPDGQFGDKNDYRIDYMVYSASSTLEEEQKLWDYPLEEVFKRMIFKKFGFWIEWNLYKNG